MGSEDPTNIWRPVELSGHLPERVVTQINELIVAEQLKPGDQLAPERELAALLGVSRPVVREAVRVLAARGQLSVRHGRGMFVESPSAKQDLRAAIAGEQVGLQELFAMRGYWSSPRWPGRRATPPRTMSGSCRPRWSNWTRPRPRRPLTL